MARIVLLLILEPTNGLSFVEQQVEIIDTLSEIEEFRSTIKIIRNGVSPLYLFDGTQRPSAINSRRVPPSYLAVFEPLDLAAREKLQRR